MKKKEKYLQNGDEVWFMKGLRLFHGEILRRTADGPPGRFIPAFAIRVEESLDEYIVDSNSCFPTKEALSKHVLAELNK